MSYAWSAKAPDAVVRRIDADRPVYFVSDLHLGDGGASDAFMGKDRALLALLDEVRKKGARLVIGGDAVDLLQARDLTPVLRAHGKLLRALSDLADTHGVHYICGNHDDDLRLYKDLLRWDVCTRLWIGPDVAVQHGHEWDPWIGQHIERAGLATRVHHEAERLLGVWLRIPLGDFYNRGNRLFYWVVHKAWLALKARNVVYRKLGFQEAAQRSEDAVTYWVRNEAGDPMLMFRPALAWARANGARTVVCGHSHMPANVAVDGVRFVNTGSWTFGWAQYAVLEDGAFTVRDWVSGREYLDELYRPLLEGDLDHLDMDRWWRNQYLGWLRFRSGELRRRAEAR